jgi:hypothetical protein
VPAAIIPERYHDMLFRIANNAERKRAFTRDELSGYLAPVTAEQGISNLIDVMIDKGLILKNKAREIYYPSWKLLSCYNSWPLTSVRS